MIIMINTSSENNVEMVETSQVYTRLPCVQKEENDNQQERRRVSYGGRYDLVLAESDAEGSRIRRRTVEGRRSNCSEQEAMSERSVNSIIEHRLESVEHQMFLNKTEKSEQVKDRKLIRKDRRKRRYSRMVRELKRNISDLACNVEPTLETTSADDDGLSGCLC